jgi:hypothetical protein
VQGIEINAFYPHRQHLSSNRLRKFTTVVR